MFFRALYEDSTEKGDIKLRIKVLTSRKILSDQSVESDFLCLTVFAQLSPALRNRFTEIWCPQSNSRSDLVQIIQHNLRSGLSLDGKLD